MAKEGGEINVGKRLQQARKAAGFDIADIADISNIPKSKLEAMERNDFVKVGGDIYVVGYIRKFGSIVTVDTDELVAAYKAKHSQGSIGFHNTQSNNIVTQTDAIHDAPIDAAGETGARGKRSKGLWIVLTLVALLMALIGIILFAGQDNESVSATTGNANSAQTATRQKPPVQEAAAERAREIPSSLESTSGQSTSTPSAGSAVEDSLAAASEISEDGAALLSAQQQNASNAINVALTENAGDVSAANEGLGNGSNVALDSSVSANNSQTPISSASESPSLQISFSEDCWLRVRDSAGVELFEGVKAANTTLSLEGNTPITVRLGNARAASITYKGRAVDASPPPGRTTRTLIIE